MPQTTGSLQLIDMFEQRTGLSISVLESKISDFKEPWLNKARVKPIKNWHR